MQSFKIKFPKKGKVNLICWVSQKKSFDFWQISSYNMISYTVGFIKVIAHLQGMLGLVCTAGQSPDFALFQWGNRTFENSRKPNKYSRLGYIKICNCNTYMEMIYAKGQSSNVNFCSFAFSGQTNKKTICLALYMSEIPLKVRSVCRVPAYG